MRKTSSINQFPYKHTSICYIEVFKDGKIENPLHANECDRHQLKEAYERAKSKETKLYCTYLGTYAGHLFIVDDLDSLANAFKFKEESERIEEALLPQGRKTYISKNELIQGDTYDVKIVTCNRVNSLDNLNIVTRTFSKFEDAKAYVELRSSKVSDKYWVDGMVNSKTTGEIWFSISR